MSKKVPTIPVNKGKVIGQKRPFTPKQIRRIKSVLGKSANQGSQKALRDLTLLAVSIDTMLRGCDLLRLTKADVTDHKGRILPEFTVFQQKTKRGVLVALSPETRIIVMRWLTVTKKCQGDYLFISTRKRSTTPLTTAQYRRLVKYWATLAQVDIRYYSGHSTRRTKAALVYEKTRDVEVVRELLGQKSTAATSAYLNIGKRRALEIAKRIKL